MKTLIAATTLSVMMAAGGAMAQTYDANIPVGTPGSDPSVITPSTNHDSTAMDYDASGSMTMDTTTTGSISNNSISTNSNCSPANAANPAPLPTELQAPAVQSCNPR
jgi:hypothetical protein